MRLVSCFTHPVNKIQIAAWKTGLQCFIARRYSGRGAGLAWAAAAFEPPAKSVADPIAINAKSPSNVRSKLVKRINFVDETDKDAGRTEVQPAPV